MKSRYSAFNFHTTQSPKLTQLVRMCHLQETLVPKSIISLLICSELCIGIVDVSKFSSCWRNISFRLLVLLWEICCVVNWSLLVVYSDQVRSLPWCSKHGELREISVASTDWLILSAVRHIFIIVSFVKLLLTGGYNLVLPPLIISR